VYFAKQRKKWVACIMFRGLNYGLGAFCDIKDAANARHIAEDKIFGNFVKWYDENINPKLDRREGHERTSCIASIQNDNQARQG